MRNQPFVRGNLYRDDHLRALVTDTAPAEVPIIFSNDGFYLNVKKKQERSASAQNFLHALLDTQVSFYTVPYRFRVTKDTFTTRRLSLIHPRSQISVAEFYKKYEELLCYYNSTSPFSIRAPTKIGSSYFFRSSVSERNKYKGSTIDTLQFEKRVRNPASYFSYRGHDRLYKFFESTVFTRLEKKFPIMWFGDISKCFDSIYSHSITWAVKDMPISKENTSAHSFGSRFDRIMQKMNYNETNGICIGPEVSRIFAETILQKIDEDVIEKSNFDGLRYKIDYECKRYVDDIIIFATNERVAAHIYANFEDCLGKFNLHFNELKLEKFSRPFQTPKSNIIHNVKSDLEKLSKMLVEHQYLGNKKHNVPANLYRPNAVLHSFLRDVKSTCMTNSVGYDMVANYIVSSLSNLLERVLEDSEISIAEFDVPLDNYYRHILLVLESMFFFYTVHPTVSMSLRLSKSIVQAIRFVDANLPVRKTYLSDQLTSWTYDLVRALNFDGRGRARSKIPVEVINIVLAVSEADEGDHFTADFLRKTIFDLDQADYFTITSFLFFVGDKSKYKELKKKVEVSLHQRFEGLADPQKMAHDAHLLLDLIGCPHLSVKSRTEIMKSACRKMNLPNFKLSECAAIVSELESDHWFVNWSNLDLLNMIKKKELSSVY